MKEESGGTKRTTSSVKFKVPRKFNYTYYAFTLISLINSYLNYDNGVIPIILNRIQDKYGFTNTELGLVGFLPYAGTVISAPLISNILLNYSSKNSLICSFLLNIASLIVFGLAINKWMFFISKLFIGVSQSLFNAYNPIWVDIFAPKHHRKLWMSLIQLGIFLGRNLGYIVTSLFSYAGDRGWRYSVLTQIVCGVILVLLFSLIPKQYVNFDPSRDEKINFDVCTCDKSIQKKDTASKTNENLTEDNSYSLKRSRTLDFVLANVSLSDLKSSHHLARMHSNVENAFSRWFNLRCSKCFVDNVKTCKESMQIKNLSSWSKFRLLMKEGIFISCCLVVSNLYFRWSGSQFWMTKLAVSHYKIKENVFHLLFAVKSISGTMLGIITGSYLVDEIIYHYPDLPLIVDYTLLIWISITCVSGVLIIVIQKPMVLVVCLFLILFFGASIVPTITLMSIEYLPVRLKPAGSSFFIFQYNILGFILGTFLPGVAFDLRKSYSAGLSIIYLSGFVGFSAIIAIIWIKTTRIKRENEQLPLP